MPSTVSDNLSAPAGKAVAELSSASRQRSGALTERERTHRMLLEQEHMLALIARGSALEECLIALTQAIERLQPYARAAVLMADETRTRMDRIFTTAIAPALATRIQEMPINGTCSTAIRRGEPVTCTDIAADGRWAKPWRDLCVAHGVRAAHSTPVFGADGRAVASFVICFDEPHEPDPWERGVGQFGAHLASIAIEREQTTQALHVKEAELEREIASARLLQGLSAQLAEEHEIESLYERILDAAVALMRADYASMQMLYPERGSGGELRLLGFRGFNPQAARFWEWVTADSESTCGVALHTGKRVLVTDVEQCAFMAGTEDLATYRQTGIRAVQSTPLVSRAGRMLGMISTHWSQPRQPTDEELRLFDILARQAADLIEHKQAREKLEVADRQKDEFLAMLAHELRNPLAPIGNASEILSRMFAEETRAQLPIGIIKRQTAHLTRLVDDLLDISRITLGHIQLDRRPIDLASVVAQAIETVEPQLRAKEHNLSVGSCNYQEPLYVSGDLARLVQCVGNLLSNAAKYTEPHGEIRLQTRAVDAHAIIEVSDTGGGIAPELLPRIFDLFVQGDRTLDRAHGGLGIGLSVVKRLVEMHEGQVAAHSAGIGRGSTFEIRLPRIAPPSAPSCEAPRPQMLPRRVLVVDDNADAANSLAMLLCLQGHEAQAVHSGREALARIESFKPDVALLDLGLPEMNGYEVAQQLRAIPSLHGVRLIALTGYGQAEDRRRTQAAGFDDHLVKPVDLQVLELTLAELPDSVEGEEERTLCARCASASSLRGFADIHSSR